MNVLLLEPDLDLAEVMADSLAGRGHNPAVANTAQQAVDFADQCLPDLVIIELFMDGHNGFEFIHEFKSYPEWFDTPIIIFSELSREQLDVPPKMLESMSIAEHFYKPTTSLARLAQAVSDYHP